MPRYENYTVEEVLALDSWTEVVSGEDQIPDSVAEFVHPEVFGGG